MIISHEGKDDELLEQAALLECLLPRLMRRMFTLDPDHPVNELPVGQLRLCSILQSGPRPMSALGDELRVSISSLTQLADRLEKAGLVERIHGCEDRRMKLLALTAEGEALMRSRQAGRIRGAAQVLAELPPGAREKVLDTVRLLLKVAISSQPAPEPEPADALIE
ncbi:MAG TPA: MarR family transcriptional regulator [Armatimonadota bacterium]|nr:MarR family transcriptional regulator [Armatimonadota bacterium]